MSKFIIKQAHVINEGKTEVLDLLIQNDRIEKIASTINDPHAKEINAEGLFLMPGAIDDQVHFREPGLTHKGDIMSESRAAAVGGVTTFFEMPNTSPQAVTQSLLADKYAIAQTNAFANYSFFMGTTNDNYDEVMRTDPKTVCGIKIFMGSSTGNMLVDDAIVLEKIFANAPTIIATHCEDEQTIKNNLAHYLAESNQQLNIHHHPLIRSEQACYLSSSMAIELAKKNGTRLHILHISTGIETTLFTNKIPLKDKKITSEACIHHLWFSDEDYKEKGNFIKWNPAVKTANDRSKIWEALLDGRIDVIATDHAPHTFDEKNQAYAQAPSGGPLVQHSIQAMFDFYHQNKISKEMIVEKMCHNPAILFNVKERGYIREGYFADLVLVQPKPQLVKKEELLYKCGWSPFENHTFNYRIHTTFINGVPVYENGILHSNPNGQRVEFER